MKNLRLTALALIVSCGAALTAPAAVSAEESGSVYTADQAEFIVEKYLQQESELEALLGDETAVSYWRFINRLQEDDTISWVIEKSSCLVDEYPNKKDYVEILANLMTMQTGELAEQIENQSQFDHFKGVEDYVLQVADIAAGIAGGVGSKAYKTISPIVDAALGGGKLAVENAELARYFEASIQDYTQSSAFLEAISTYAEDELLRETASDLLKANEELLQKRLEYLGDSAGTIAEYQADYFLGNLYSDLLKETTLYQTDETVKWYVDGVEGLRQSLLSILSLGKAAFNCTIMAADLQYGTSATFNRYQEMRIVADAAGAISEANQKVSVSSRENPQNVLDDVREKTNYYRLLTAVHARGEYLIYQLLMNYAGVLSERYKREDLLRNKSTEDWYQGQTEKLTFCESTLDTMFQVPDDDDSLWLQAYAPVLDQYYTALTEGWSEKEYEQAGLCKLASGQEPAALGYCFTDVDYDGSKELMIGKLDNGGVLYDFYTLSGDTPVRLAFSTETDQYYYCTGHEILRESRQAGGKDMIEYYKMDEDALKWIETFRYDDSRSTWILYYEKDGSTEETPMTEEEKEEIQSDYVTKEIAFTPFTQWKDQESPKPLTKEQLKQVALDLGIPEEMAEQVQADQGEAYYWGTGERWITPVQFYQNGKIVAGASVDSFTLEQCRNILRYSGPSSDVSAGDVSRLNGSILAGDWQIDGERTVEENGVSLTEIYGTGLQYGNKMRFERDGEFSYFAGIGTGGTGSWAISDGRLVYTILTDMEQKQETGELLAEGEGDFLRLIMDNGGYMIYWKKTVVADNAVSVDVQKLYENGTEQAVLTGLDPEGNAAWTYKTRQYGRTELERVNPLGVYDGKYYFVDDGVVKALYMTDGTICWRNGDFGGAATGHVFGPDKKLYLCGYYGPDFFVVDNGGNTVKRIEKFAPDSSWASGMEYRGDSIMVYMDQMPSSDATGYLVSLNDYSINPAAD